MNAPLTILRETYKLPMDELIEHRDGRMERYTSENKIMQIICEYDHTPDQYLTMIGDLLGYDGKGQVVDHWRDHNMPKYVFRYLVLGIILDYKNGEHKNIDNIYLNAIVKAQAYLATRPEIVYCTSADESAPPKVDVDGNLVGKKGDKKVMALEWWAKNKDRIIALPETERRKTAITELKTFGWSDGTCSTYYQNLKSNLWK